MMSFHACRTALASPLVTAAQHSRDQALRIAGPRGPKMIPCRAPRRGCDVSLSCSGCWNPTSPSPPQRIVHTRPAAGSGKSPSSLPIPLPRRRACRQIASHVLLQHNTTHYLSPERSAAVIARSRLALRWGAQRAFFDATWVFFWGSVGRRVFMSLCLRVWGFRNGLSRPWNVLRALRDELHDVCCAVGTLRVCL